MAQLLKRPEIVIEDFAAVVREGYPEFFAEIASNASESSGADPSPRYKTKTATAASVRDGTSLSLTDSIKPSSSGKLPSIKLTTAARNEMKTVETEIKYAGYLDQQRKSIERLKKAEQRVIPEWFDYGKVSGLSREMNEKLQRVRPRTLGHASRIPGVTPAAVSLIHVYIEIQGKRFAAAQSLG
jgi:tRNA uridine 5-carboxymethylaminomethyl modification enzyme